MPVRCRPKTMTSTPATRDRVDLYCTASWPTSVESAPRVTKTMLKPRTNAIEFSMTLRSKAVSCDFSSSMPTPEMRDTYPGTSGNTHGERNDTRPAKKAAGIPMSCMQTHCTWVWPFGGAPALMPQGHNQRLRSPGLASLARTARSRSQRGFGNQLSNQFGRNLCGQNHSLAFLLDLNAFHDLVKIGIRLLSGNRGFCRFEDFQKGIGLQAELRGGGIVLGEGFSTEMDIAQVLHGSHNGCRSRERDRHTRRRCRRVHVKDGPSQAG